MRMHLGCINCIKNQLIDKVGRCFSVSRYIYKPEEKLRRPRIKHAPIFQGDHVDYKMCNAYCNGESYNIDEVRKYFIKDTGRYTIGGLLPKDAVDTLHVSRINSGESGDIFLFRRLGAFVCWNLPEEEICMLNQVLREFVINPVATSVSEKESELMNYFSTKEDTSLLDGDIYLNSSSSEQKQVLEKLAFSNAMALSVKLGMWELSLETFSGSLRYVPELLKKGTSNIMSRKEVLRKIGELLTIRHEINLYSDLLITPDFYWDREDLERLYSKTCTYLEVSKRTMVLNEKLNLCSELVEMLRSHLNDQHSHRLEWLIILLIAIEVLFEVIHTVERFS